MTDDWQYLQFKMTAFWADSSCHPKSHSLTCSVFFVYVSHGSPGTLFEYDRWHLPGRVMGPRDHGHEQYFVFSVSGRRTIVTTGSLLTLTAYLVASVWGRHELGVVARHSIELLRERCCLTALLPESYDPSAPDACN